METGYVLWSEPQPTYPIDIYHGFLDQGRRAENLDTAFQWNLAARAASRQSNCKGPPGLPCAVTPQGTWPPCIPSYPSTIITILSTSVCPVVNSHKVENGGVGVFIQERSSCGGGP